ncbi:hypothetical protein SLS62_005496 [Diatrype stigma]|uniref:Enoyl reductase (ER) domain-containing protein n=1 Tax=Diatrype stigma TaxID=117547 RepID=A0AAN9V2Y0_9PEZI
MPKQAIIQSSIEAVDFINTPIPTPGDKEVIIKVVVAGTNPKDWKMPLWQDLAHNSGDDMAGIVHSVGKDVYEFKPGDRVAAVHETGKENGSFAEYAVAPDWTTFHIPHNISFEEAATIPLAALTAALALYSDLKLPAPYGPVRLAEGPIIGVAGQASDYASPLVDYVVDYRKGGDALVAAVREIAKKEGLPGGKIPNVFDAISDAGSLEATLRFVDPDAGTVSTVLPPKLFAKDKENYAYPAGVTGINSAVPQVWSTHKDFGYLWSRYLGRLLESGALKPHPYEVVPGGLRGVLTGLQKLRDGKASAVKYVYRIDETGDVPSYLPGAKESDSGSQPSQNSQQLRDFSFTA